MLPAKQLRWLQITVTRWHHCMLFISACNMLYSPKLLFGANYQNILWLYCQTDQTDSCYNKKAVLSQRWPHDVPYIWVPWKFLRLPVYAYGYFSQIVLMHFFLIYSMNVHRKFEMHSLSRSWDNSDWSFVGGCEPLSRGRGGCRKSRWYHSKECWWLPIGPP